MPVYTSDVTLRPIFTRSNNVSWKRISPGFSSRERERERKRAKRIPKWSVSFETIVAKIWRPRLPGLKGFANDRSLNRELFLKRYTRAARRANFTGRHLPVWNLSIGYFQLWLEIRKFVDVVSITSNFLKLNSKHGTLLEFSKDR